METNESILLKAREVIFARRTEATLYTHIGYFMSWFSAVELQLTFMLAIALRYKDLDDFELLVKGMDARVKCERLRKACKRHKPLGPNMSARLDHFEDKIIPIRNKISHSFLVLIEAQGPVYLSSLAKLPFAEIGETQIGGRPEPLPLIELFELGFWLNHFSEDLGTVNAQPHRETFEIDQPRTPLLMEARPPNPRKARRVKADEPPRKEEPNT